MLRFEQLEERLALYVAVNGWSNPAVTYSFPADGTLASDGQASSLFATLDPKGAEVLRDQGDRNADGIVDIGDVANASAHWGEPGVDIFEIAKISNNWLRTKTDVWQDVIRSALDEWADNSGLTFSEVADDNSQQGSAGAIQGSDRFGDIRFFLIDLEGSLAGYTNYPQIFSTIGGDVTLDKRGWSLRSGQAGVDLYSVALHEIGHAIGLGHENTKPSVMRSTLSGVYDGLEADDIAGVQSIYGPRAADAAFCALGSL